jgi:hypothetical protein
MVAHTLKPVATVDLAVRPLRAYRGLLAGVVLERQLALLDAYIVTLLLEFLPGPLALADLTGTPAEVSCLALAQERVARVVTWPGPDPTTSSWAACTQALEKHDPGTARWEISPDLGSALRRLDRPSGEPSLRHLVVIAADRQGAGSGIAELAREILDMNRAAVVIALGLGRIGECRQLAALASTFPPDSRRTLTLARELRGMAQNCSVGLVYDRSHEQVTATLERIENLFVTNYDYLDLLTEVCALRAGGARGRSSQASPTSPEPCVRGGSAAMERLLAELEQERTRPLFKAIPLQAGRRMAQFARKHRGWLAPPDSFRGRLGKSLINLQRELRARATTFSEPSEF